MTMMKSLKHGAIALLLVGSFITAGVYEAAAIPALYGTYGKGEYSSSTLVEVDEATGEIIQVIGQVGYTVNGLAWDPTTQRLYGSTRESNTSGVTGGSHDGANNSSFLVDSSKDFIDAGVLVGMQVRNQSDGSWGTITAVSTTTITAALTGGSENLWDIGDSYNVYKLTFNGLIRIDLATGAGTPVGVQGWGLGASAVVTNITVNSSGQMYGWTEEGDDLVIINKSTGVATVVGNSGISTWANGLAFYNSSPTTQLLYMVNGDGRYYVINPLTGGSALYGDLEPGVELPAHHGDFHPYTNLYYGIRNAPWPWEDSTSYLLKANLATGTVLSMVPTAYDLHTLAFVDVPGVLQLDLDYDDGDNELTMDFTIGTEVQAVLVVWLHVFDQKFYLGGVVLPAIDPRATMHTWIPFPNVGKIGVLATLVTQGSGIAYSAWETVDTGF